MRIAEKLRGSLGFSKNEKMSRMDGSPVLNAFTAMARPSIPGCRRAGGFHQLDVQAERLKLLDEDVEALGQACLECVLALDDGLVHAGSALHVVALDREELL